MPVLGFFDTVSRDLLYALRNVRKNPAFAATVILTLALAIGGNTLMFTVIRAVLVKPLQYPDPSRLVSVSGGATPVRFAEMQAAARAFTGLGAFTGQENLTLTGGNEPLVLSGARVSANFLRILGVSPQLGRSFLPEEDAAGGRAVALISAELWQQRFAGSSAIVGQTADLEGRPFTIIGVLPPRFHFPYPGIDVWLTAPAEWPLMAPKSRALSPFLSIFGRLRPGLNLDQADAEMRGMYRQYLRAHPAMLDAKPKSPETLKPLKERLVGNIRSLLWMLFGAVCFVLLIACANVAGLLLARAAVRSREFAIRAALGAARRRLIGQLLVESILLSSAGGALGLLLAAWGVRVIPHLTAFDLPRAAEIHLDWQVLAFGAALSIATGLVFGLAPSLEASQPDLIGALRARGDGAFKGRLNLRGLLVVAQVALSCILLIGAALLLQSMARLRNVDLGFNSANLLTMRISLPLLRYDTDQKRAAFFQELTRRVNALPGVRGVTAAMFFPMTGLVGTPVQDAAKAPLKLNDRTIATVSVVEPRYFHTLNIPLRRGRDFTERDNDSSPRVAIIDEACARHFWPAYPAGQDPVGQRLLIGGVNQKPVQIIGIAAGVHQNLENTGWPETVYVSFAQDGTPSSAMLALRTIAEPLKFAGMVRQQVRSLDRDQPITAVRTMDELLEAQIGQRRITVILLGAFAGMSFLLAIVGIYGVIAYSVAQRSQEIGIRRALGAQPANILRLVLGQGFQLALAGVTLGLIGAFSLTRVLRHLLFQMSAADPWTFGGTALLFVLVALAASYIPAQRATRIDPMAALRIE
jgi:putative ABC transport system permease protein